MTAIPESQAKTQYIEMWQGDLLGYSLKVASTLIYAHATGGAPNRRNRARHPRIGQHEVLQMRNNDGRKVHLIVRHPLDRLVSNYVFWTKVANNYIKPILEASPRDHNIIMGLNEFKNVTIEEWHAAASRHYNAHWVPQAEYHSRDGELVPNILWPIESLALLRCEKMNASPRKEWETYFTPEFREKMEEYYAADIELYNRAKEEWNGQAPSVLRSNA